MQQQLREQLGKAVHQAWQDSAFPELKELPVAHGRTLWESVRPEAKERYMSIAEAVVKELAGVLLPSLVQVLFDGQEFREMLKDLVK